MHLRSAALLATLPTLLACTSQSAGPTVYPVAGVVTQDDKPVAGAVVQFHPTGPDYGPLAADAVATGGQATTVEDGRYSVQSTFDLGKTASDGLPAGAYLVTVRKMEVPTGPDSGMRPPKNILDPRYASVDSTPVKVTITPNGPHNLDIPL